MTNRTLTIFRPAWRVRSRGNHDETAISTDRSDARSLQSGDSWLGLRGSNRRLTRRARRTGCLRPGERQGTASRRVSEFRADGIARDSGPHGRLAQRGRHRDVRFSRRPGHHRPGGLRPGRYVTDQRERGARAGRLDLRRPTLARATARPARRAQGLHAQGQGHAGVATRTRTIFRGSPGWRPFPGPPKGCTAR